MADTLTVDVIDAKGKSLHDALMAIAEKAEG